MRNLLNLLLCKGAPSVCSSGAVCGAHLWVTMPKDGAVSRSGTRVSHAKTRMREDWVIALARHFTFNIQNYSVMAASRGSAYRPPRNS